MEIKHTFLFQEGCWEAKGCYFDKDGKKVPFVGESKITHTEELWINEGLMKILSGEGAEFKNSFEFEPVKKGEDSSRWKSYNPALGTLVGKLVVVDDALLTNFTTESGEYEGFEYLQKVSDDHYINRGVLYMGSMKLSSWTTELKKIK